MIGTTESPLLGYGATGPTGLEEVASRIDLLVSFGVRDRKLADGMKVAPEKLWMWEHSEGKGGERLLFQELYKASLDWHPFVMLRHWKAEVAMQLILSVQNTMDAARTKQVFTGLLSGS